MSMTVTASEARSRFARIAEEVARTGSPVTVFKNSRPWVEIHPVEPREVVPTESTRQALREADSLKTAGARFSSFHDLMAALDIADAEG